MIRTVLHIAAKDLLLQWRDRLGFFWWMIGFPLLISVLIGTIFASMLEGPTRAMPVALVDEARSPESAAYADILKNMGSVQPIPMPEAQARDAVRRGRLMAFVVLKSGFRLSPAVFSGKGLPVAVGVDPVHQAESAYLQAVLNQAAIEFLQRTWFDPQRRSTLIDAIFADAGQESLSRLERRTIDTALNLLGSYFDAAGPTTRPGPGALGNIELLSIHSGTIRHASSFEICFPIGILWGLVALAAEFAMAIVKEQEAGTMLRLRVSPVARWQILTGSGLACFTAAVGVTLFLLSVGHWAFDVRFGSPAVLVAAIPSIGICIVGLTLVLATLGKTESSVGGASWAVLLILSMLGGGMVPQVFMPAWMEAAGRVSPVRWAILALEGGIWRQFTLAEAVKPCAILLIQGLLCGLVGVIVLSRRRA